MTDCTSKSCKCKTYDPDHFGGVNGIYLYHLNKQVRRGCSKAVDAAVNFMCTTSRGIGHNRHRARFSRLLKYIELTENQAQSMVDTILLRFETGDIDEQFVDQLRFSLWLDKERTVANARLLLNSDKDYIVRYAKRLLNLGGAK